MHGVQRVPLRGGPVLQHRVRAQLAAIARHAQQPVHGGALLGGVDQGTGQHGIALGLHATGLGQIAQQGLGTRQPAVLGQIGIDMRCLLRQLRQALGILGKSSWAMS